MRIRRTGREAIPYHPYLDVTTWRAVVLTGDLMRPVAECTTSINEAVWIQRAGASVAEKSRDLLLLALEMALTKTDVQSAAKMRLYVVR
jgi:hypothetical protein